MGPMSPIFSGAFATIFEFDLQIVVDKIPIFMDTRVAGEK
jgi:hypothetical protein